MVPTTKKKKRKATPTANGENANKPAITVVKKRKAANQRASSNKRANKRASSRFVFLLCPSAAGDTGLRDAAMSALQEQPSPMLEVNSYQHKDPEKKAADAKASLDTELDSYMAKEEQQVEENPKPELRNITHETAAEGHEALWSLMMVKAGKSVGYWRKFHKKVWLVSDRPEVENLAAVLKDMGVEIGILGSVDELSKVIADTLKEIKEKEVVASGQPAEN